jgi:hypothetical protein
VRWHRMVTLGFHFAPFHGNIVLGRRPTTVEVGNRPHPQSLAKGEFANSAWKTAFLIKGENAARV